MTRFAAIAAIATILALAPVAQAGEVIDDIVAWVNGEIITKSDYEAEEETMIAEAYRRYSGEELDRHVEAIRKSLLQQMIDRKILVHHAQGLGYDIVKMKESLFKDFLAQQGLEDTEQIDELLARDGMTVEQLKQRLVEMYTPEEVIDFEVVKRLSVGDREVDAYYVAHPEEFVVPAEATFREIVLLDDEETTRGELRDRAAWLSGQVAEGADFAELAREHSQAGTAAEGGLIGPVNPPDVAESLREVVFSIPPGQVSEPIATPYGFHLVLVEERADERMRTLEEVRGSLKRHLENAKYRNQLQEFLALAREESEWCVKPRYKELLSTPAPSKCDNL